jgi:dihydroneopterin aldolase
VPDPGPLDDRIELRGLRVVGYVGVLEEEQRRAQPFEVDLDVYADLRAAGRSDDLTDTVDYGAITEAAARVVETERHRLLERVVDRIAEVILAEHPGVDRVTVTIRKLRPPIAHDIDTSAVRVTRGR